MTQYIAKSSVVGEIKKKLDKHSKLHSFNYGAVKDLESLWNFLDTIEVRDLDLGHEIEKVKKMQRNFEIENDTIIEFCAKHFFELGLKVQKGE